MQHFGEIYFEVLKRVNLIHFKIFSKDSKCIKYLIYNYEYLSRQIEPNQEEEEIQEEDVDSEAGLEDKIIPENYRSQHQMQAEGEAELDDLSDFENIWEPRQDNNNGSNIVEMEDSYDEIDILNDDFEFS